MISVSSRSTFNKARSTQMTKFTKLTSYAQKNRRKQEDLASHPLRRTVINRSARSLMPVEEDILALGLNFAVVPRVLPKEEIVQRLGPKLFHLKNDVASNIRVQITEVLRRAKLPRSNLTKNMKDAVSNLRADKSIHILKADKSNATVVLNTKTYKELKSDPTAKIERKICSKLSDLKKSDKLSQKVYDHLKPSATVCPKFYGLPKIHKPDVPLRPIVASQSSPTYNLAKYLAEILKPIVGNSEHHVVNSKEFITKIEQTKLDEEEILVSFDVVCLFTNVPMDHSTTNSVCV